MFDAISPGNPNRWWLSLLAGTVFAAILALCPSIVTAQECKGGICASVDSYWDTGTKKMVKKVRFSGFPRTKQDYVTDHYNIRGLPDPYPKQYEAWPNHIGSGIVLNSASTYDISIQACRTRGAVIKHSFCTSWVTFRIY